MGDKKAAIFKIDNEMELIKTNIALGHRDYRFDMERRELLKKSSKTQDNIINKIAKANREKDFSMILFNDNTREN
ncbi:hypothetical protein [Clostridium vincentii]|uniref:Uncharacterized protein n=1 Tax=Clostridium vincentii TaxID=52704 RepID=A0A2T0BDU1_9CLOT|nr:hypothetical protein [Clostridium vincentii]PRR82023.1 hypothetical protein CLVI_20880 [Clostridium vincentii]